MRAVFTTKIPAISTDRYPTNEELLSRVRILGWESLKAKHLDTEDERLKWYKKHANNLWGDMPEVASEEKEYVIFYSVLQDNRTHFIITRLSEGQATFRLLHPNLDKLQASTEYMVKELIKPVGNLPALEISNQRISIYERGYEDIIIQGRVIPHALKEAWRVDKKNILFAVASFILSVPTFLALLWVNSGTNIIIGGTIERASTAFLTTFIVSIIGFIQTYIEIYGIKLIDWSVASSKQVQQK